MNTWLVGLVSGAAPGASREFVALKCDARGLVFRVVGYTFFWLNVRDPLLVFGCVGCLRFMQNGYRFFVSLSLGLIEPFDILGLASENSLSESAAPPAGLPS